MTFEEAQAFLYTTGSLSRLGLGRMRELTQRLGRPQGQLRFIHVAGSNGKGSVCAMLSSILRCAGHKTGLYTSPHLHCITERVQIDGVPVSREDFTAAAEAVAAAVSGMEDDPPTVFERMTALALVCFARAGCDAVVWEVGLGGRLDATNVIEAPAVSVIGGIGLEHTQQLGDTLEQIAFEKGGIVKEGHPTVLCRQDEAVEGTIRAICARRGSPLHITGPVQARPLGLDGQTIAYGPWEGVFLPLLGTYQGQNAALALETVCVLRRQGWAIPDGAVRRGMAEARWPARLEIMERQPLILLDGAHNPHGAAALETSLKGLRPGEKWLLVMGVMADKDYGGMLRHLLPLAGEVVTAQPEYERALSSRALAETIRGLCPLPVHDGGSVPAALALARQRAPAGPVCVFGSLYQAGEVRAFFGKE